MGNQRPRMIVAALLCVSTPALADPPVRTGGTGVPVQFETNQEGVAFHYRKVSGPASRWDSTPWTRLCLGKCETSLEAGYYKIGLSHGAREPVAAENAVELRSPVLVEGGYTSNADRRQAGWLILGIAGTSALVAGLSGIGLLTENSQASRNTGAAIVAAGSLGFVLSLTFGFVLLGRRDEAAVAVLPARPPSDTTPAAERR